MSVFISYNHKDGEFAERLALELTANNIKVWKDSWEIGVGDSLIGKIEQGLGGARFLCILLSKHTGTSAWVERELRASLIREIEDKDLTILPVLLDDTKVPLFLRDKLYADFRTDFHSAFKKLLAVVLPALAADNGTVERGDRWFLRWGAVCERGDGVPTVTVNALLFNVDESYSLLMLSRFVGADGSRRLEHDPRELVTVVLAACSNFFGSVSIPVSPSTPRRAAVTLRDTDETPLFEVSIECIVLGQTDNEPIAFGVGACFADILASRK